MSPIQKKGFTSFRSNASDEFSRIDIRWQQIIPNKTAMPGLDGVSRKHQWRRGGDGTESSENTFS